MSHAAPVTVGVAWGYLLPIEGYKTHPYKDGLSTSVGVGHCLTCRGETVKETYSASEIRAFFIRDFAVSQEVARHGIKDFDNLPQDVQLVAIGLAFSVGPTGFMRFRMFRLAMSQRAYMAAATELADSKWYQQVSPRRARAAYNTLWNRP